MGALLLRQISIISILLSAVILGIQALPEQYIIYPKIDLSLGKATAIGSAITSLSSDSSKVIASQYDPLIPPMFWIAPLTEEAAAELKRHPWIEGVELNKIGGEFQESPGPLQATPIYVTQHAPAATELRVISQPSGDANLNKYKDYVFPSRAGEASYIYHIETGINGDHNEFRGRQGEWVFTNLAVLARQNVKNETPLSAGHSTCTASKASGNLYGAAKYATLVVVKMPDLSDGSMMDGLNAAYHHIRMRNRGTRSVLSISWGSIKTYSRGDDLDLWARGMRDILRLLAKKGVITACAAGNNAQERADRRPRLTVDTLPAAFDDENSFFLHAPPIIADGSSSFTGTSFCANTAPKAAPLVAGVIAGILPLSKHVDPWWRRRTYVIDQLSWRRPNGGKTVLWNRVDQAHNILLDLNGNTSLTQFGDGSSNASAADWPDTSLPRVASLGMGQTAVQ
ncbi:MAG: hypothetical protein Q9208_001501 [Pyrenodesmia sp. 3 TL-2023]